MFACLRGCGVLWVFRDVASRGIGDLVFYLVRTSAILFVGTYTSLAEVSTECLDPGRSSGSNLDIEFSEGTATTAMAVIYYS